MLYVKGPAEKSKRYEVYMTSRQYSGKYLFRVKLSVEYNMTKNGVYSIPYSCGKIYKGKTCSLLKVRRVEHRKVECWGEIWKSGMERKEKQPAPVGSI